jgi:primary-amine oxidase
MATPHPLDPLAPEEIRAAVALARAYAPPAGEAPLSDDLRFISVSLVEPPKRHAGPHPRAAFVIALDVGAGLTRELTVDLDQGAVSRARALSRVQPGIVIEEFIACENAVKASPLFHAALARRGITEFDKVIVDPWSAGAYGDERYPDRRIARGLAYLRGSDLDTGYGRPIEGLIIVVDLLKFEVLEVEDHGVTPLPELTGIYAAEAVGPLRDDLKPLDIIQPEGASFQVEGQLVTWQKWSMRIGFTPREGLVLHEIAYQDGDRLRPILNRASMCEMLVPYGDPSPTQAKKNVFDNGEYGIGRMANSLTLGCDCLGLIHYFDACMTAMNGEPIVLKNAVCMHEEDYGTLWKHRDWRTGRSEIRRSRRLVVSFFATVGNYDYGFFWYFYQNGDIQCELKLTGVLSVAAIAPGERPTHGTLVAPGLYAPNHQHHFIFRLDFDVDGGGNSLVEVNTVTDPWDAERNPYGTAFHAEYTPLATEKAAGRDADHNGGRGWLVTNPNRLNAFGRPTAYKVMPGPDVARPFCQPDSSVMKRGGFMRHTLWATAYDPQEICASGDYINQNPAPQGLSEWVERDASIDNTDLVVWLNVAHHHLPRPEEWPVMPVAHTSFMLKPVGFFDQSPAMDVPPPVPRKSCCTDS